MKNVLKDFLYRNEITVNTVTKTTGLSSSLVYRLLSATNRELLNIKVVTSEQLKKIGFNLEEELNNKKI